MRFIDIMPPELLETLTLKNMIPEPSKHIDRKRVGIQQTRIDACDTLIDHILDDIPHRDQQPILDLLVRLKTDLEDEMQDALTP